MTINSSKSYNNDKSINDPDFLERQEILHEKKYEGMVNLNATNIIQGLWDSINEELDAA